MTVTSRTGKPIVIADYDPRWPLIFADERAMIMRACGRDAFVRIEHIGSTAVPGLAAKPIIDIMPGVRSLDAFAACISKLEAIGYQYVPEFEKPNPELNDPGMPSRRYFRKDVDGERAFHLHTVEIGSEFWRDHLLFRNYLRFYEEDLQRYAALKRRLADEYNRTMIGTNVNVGYTDFKTDFVESIKAKARARLEHSTPIVLAPYDERWPRWFEEYRKKITAAMGEQAAAIEHVGSTSVPGIDAKPTVDIAIGVRTMDGARAGHDALLALGFSKGRDNFPDWRYYDREGHAPGENVHLHIVPFGGRRWNAYLLFRDYLRSHREAATEYVRVKRELAAEFGRDRLGYVESKTEIVEEILRRARAIYVV